MSTSTDSTRDVLPGNTKRAAPLVNASLFSRVLGALGWTPQGQVQDIPPKSSSGVSRVGYQDIGGLSVEVARVREMVEYPLRHPEIFQHLGIDAPKGVLLYGPPGCGKTLIARAVAQETGAHFIHVNGPEIIQKHYGESEELLRGIFAEAQKHPASILFFDEIDAIAPNRETVLGDVEKRVVAQLLALMDGLNARGRVIVLAATNLPNNVDPALRRPGRFDREIGINPPTRDGRLEILRIHTRNMPLAEGLSLERIASRTHGFFGADLAALCREAGMRCVRDLQGQGTGGATASLAELRVLSRHFDSAIDDIDLSSIRQVVTEMPEAGWEKIGGLEEAKRQLREAVEWPLRYARRFEHTRLGGHRGVLLCGESGTGKTLLARAVASESEANFICVKGPELVSKWVGETERGIRDVFKRARQSAPCILFFDEIETLLGSRGITEGALGVGDRIIGQFILEMDNLEDHRGVIVLAASNRPELIDKALLRTGRFDLLIRLSRPTAVERLAILRLHCADCPIEAGLELESLARDCEGMTGADLESLCKRASLFAIRESIAAHPGESFPPFLITNLHFRSALDELRSASAGR